MRRLQQQRFYILYKSQPSFGAMPPNFIIIYVTCDSVAVLDKCVLKKATSLCYGIKQPPRPSFSPNWMSMLMSVAMSIVSNCFKCVLKKDIPVSCIVCLRFLISLKIVEIKTMCVLL